MPAPQRRIVRKTKSDLVLNVITAYWNFYRAIKVEEVISQSVEQMSEHLKDAKNLLQARYGDRCRCNESSGAAF